MDWLTSSMFEPLISGITDAVAVIGPVGITIMGIVLGVSLVPRLIYKFF